MISYLHQPTLTTTMKITTTQIASIHTTLADAVETAQIDLSYNRALAMQDIKVTDRNVTKAYVMEDGTVQYIFNCDIKLLNTFTPFINCIDNGAFQLVSIREEEMDITVAYMDYPKNGETRARAKKLGWILA